MALDEIGDWSVDKLRILKAYAKPYSSILQKQISAGTGKRTLSHGYIDAFAGAGEHVHKKTREIVPGSPLIALEQGFDEYHFIDLDSERVELLRAKTAGNKRVTVHHGDCNQVLLHNVLPRFKFEAFRRALCFLDPYGTHLNWDVLAAAGKMGTIEIFLNFPINDMNRNAKRTSIDLVKPDERTRMTAFWGDESWHKAMYPESQQRTLDLLGDGEGFEREKANNDAFAEAFRKRLNDKAGFKYVPKPVAMRNSNNSELYYLFFASNNDRGDKIARDIFKYYT